MTGKELTDSSDGIWDDGEWISWDYINEHLEAQELLAEYRAHAPGSDGKIGNDFVEVKTISPEKQNERVQVKRAGNFNKLVVVRISGDWSFESRMIERRHIGKGHGAHARIRWDDANAT